MTANESAAGNAGIASRLAIGHPWPGVPEPERFGIKGSVNEIVMFCLRQGAR